MVLDGVFGATNFQNEIIWKRHSAHSSAKRYGPVHDVILFYSKGEDFTWTGLKLGYEDEYLSKYYKYDDGDGRLYWRNSLTAAGTRNGSSGKAWRGFDPASQGAHWKFTIESLDALDAAGKIYWPPKGGWPQIKRYREELKGLAVSDLWGDIDKINPAGNERLGYPTQKPQALLERIIAASSNPGDIVLDPFCGCGTTIHAAQKLGRQWIGIDVTYLAINLIKRRLKDAFGEEVQFEERGQPTDFGSAKELAALDKWQFQQWALSLIDARPRTEGEGKGADRGVDGMLYFYETKDKREKILVQVKGGGVQRNDVATLLGDVNNQKFVAGILITLEKPTKPMREEAADAGRYASKLWHKKDYPKIQILTIEGLLDGTERVEAPPQDNPFAKAQREGKPEKQQEML